MSFALAGVYRRRLGFEWLGEVFALARASTVGMALTIIVTYLFRDYLDQHSRLVLIYTWILIIALCAGGRGPIRWVMIHLHRRGWNVRRVLVAGSTPVGKMVMQNLSDRHNHGYQLVGFLHETGARIDDIAGIPLIDVAENSLRGINLVLKRVLDVLCALTLLIVLSPLLALVALTIRLDSPGPIIIVQERVGRNGRSFPFLKFRSMYQGAEKRHAEIRARSIHGEDERTTKDPHDPRRTRVGRIIRKLSIDELPQLLNALRGEMSLVGPRPPLPAEVARYESWHYKRFDMQPGMTGLWQVSGRSDLNFDEMVLMDIYYIDNWSLALDLKILLRTPNAIVRMRGAY
jgi:lipopolysaccharide/colanic/teichoic acid biosynthesis glycosyltransferase